MSSRRENLSSKKVIIEESKTIEEFSEVLKASNFEAKIEDQT